MNQRTTAFCVLPIARGIPMLQGAERPGRTWFRKRTMPSWELEEQPLTGVKRWLLSGELGRKEGDLEPEGRPLSGAMSLYRYLYISTRDRKTLQALCNIQSSKEVHAGGFLYPGSAPPRRHASAALSLPNASTGLLQDHLPPLMCICSFSACQTSSEFKDRTCKR